LKKIIIAGAIVAAGAGAYIFTQQSTAPAYNVLEYIPADTPLFAAQLDPFPLKDYITSAPKIVDPSEQQTLQDLHDPAQPATNFLLSLMKTYQTGLTDADLFINTFGLPEEVRAYFYTLGLLPVFKVEIANEQAIWDLLDKTERDSGLAHKKGTLEHINYRAYPISDSTDPVNAEIIVAIDNGLLTITLNSSYQEATLLPQALGINKAKESLADSDVIKQTIKKYNFKQASLGFINHIELIKGLTTTDGNQLAKQLSRIEESRGSDNPLSSIRTEQCAADFATIAEHWPRTVAGYTQLDINAKESTLAVSTIVESNNNVILSALSELRGFIPNYVDDINNSIFAMGLGFDISNLSKTLNIVWSDLQTPSYRCQPLAKIQADIQESGEFIAMAGIGANMANGVQGVGVGLFDYALTKMDSNPQLESLDALFTLSAENPTQLFNSVKMFLPEFQHLQLSDDSEPIELIKILPIPPELKVAPKLAIKGKHLVIYNGQQAEEIANQLTSNALAKNGIYNLSFDFKKMIAPILTATELSGKEIPEEMMFLTEYDARLQMSFDVNEQGLIFKSKINNRAPK